MLKIKKNQLLQIWRNNSRFILTISVETAIASALIIFGIITLNLSVGRWNPPSVGCIIAGVMVFLFEIVYIIDRDYQARIASDMDNH